MEHGDKELETQQIVDAELEGDAISIDDAEQEGDAISIDEERRNKIEKLMYIDTDDDGDYDYDCDGDDTDYDEGAYNDEGGDGDGEGDRDGDGDEEENEADGGDYDGEGEGEDADDEDVEYYDDGDEEDIVYYDDDDGDEEDIVYYDDDDGCNGEDVADDDGHGHNYEEEDDDGEDVHRVNDGDDVHGVDEIVSPTFPNFSKLPTEIVTIILNKLSLQQKLSTVPLVCKEWYNLWLSNSDLWKTMDFIPWETKRVSAGTMLIFSKRRKRARPSLRELHFEFLDYDDFLEVLRRVGRQLERVSLLGSDMNDKWASRHAHKLPNCQYLDLSECYFLTEVGIQEFCKQCPSLKFLRVPPKGLERRFVRKVVRGVEYEIAYDHVPGKGDIRKLKLEDRSRVIHPH